VQNNGYRNIKELTTIQCKFQSATFFDDQYEKSNSDIIEICDEHFGCIKPDDVVAQLKLTRISKKLDKPSLTAIDNYITRFSQGLFSVNEEVWPSPYMTKKLFIDMLEPRTLKEAVKRFDPEDLRAACMKTREICKSVLQSESVQDIYCSNKDKT